ncbi:MAG: hypothetical protein H7A23_09045 [Leptospiraceae bacterium]|nr:hypothetical protein [Leptospiraceae bacterium]MCP5494689.1 hypothetical protein [Leptospiraceae bacterium]
MFFIEIVKQAIIEEENRNFTKALNLFNHALTFAKSESTITKLQARKAWCLHYVGNHSEAYKLFQKLLKEHKNHPTSYLLTGFYLIKTGKLKEAKKVLTEGKSKFPNYLELYLTLASLLTDTQRSNEAIDILKEALAREKLVRAKGIEKKDIWAYLGTLYFERSNYNSSIVSLKKSLNLYHEEYFPLFDLLAKCYLKINDPTNAIKYIDLRLAYYSEDPEDYIIKARAHSRLGEHHLASSSLLQAYSLENYLKLNAEDMVDFSYLLQSGFFNALEDVEFEES